MRAALTYQDATTDRDAAIAVALSELAGRESPTRAVESGGTPGPSGASLSAPDGHVRPLRGTQGHARGPGPW